MMSKTRGIWSYIAKSSKNFNFWTDWNPRRGYADSKDPKGCRRALVDIPPDPDPNCPVECERRKKKTGGILHKIKLKMIERGTNFGSKFLPVML